EQLLPRYHAALRASRPRRRGAFLAATHRRKVASLRGRSQRAGHPSRSRLAERRRVDGSSIRPERADPELLERALPGLHSAGGAQSPGRVGSARLLPRAAAATPEPPDEHAAVIQSRAVEISFPTLARGDGLARLLRFP